MRDYYRYKDKEIEEMAKFCSCHKKEVKKMKRHCSCDRCKKHHHKWDDCCKHDHKDKKDKKDRHKRKDFADVVDFAFDTKHPNFHEEDWMKLPKNQEVTVAEIKVRGAKKGDVVWLNGVFGIDNDKFFDDADIKMKIYRGTTPGPTRKIYDARIEISIDDFDKFSDKVVEPLSHVDVIYDDCDKHVSYIVTLESDERDVFLTGPVTFTGMLISKRCD